MVPCFVKLSWCTCFTEPNELSSLDSLPPFLVVFWRSTEMKAQDTLWKWM